MSKQKPEETKQEQNFTQAPKKGFCLTKAQIVAAVDLPMEKVFVPEWADGDPEAYVMLKGMTAKEKGLFEDSLVIESTRGTAEQKLDMTIYGPCLAIHSMTDDDGNRLFALEDLPILEGKSALALERVIRKAMVMNGMTKTAVDQAAKN